MAQTAACTAAVRIQAPSGSSSGHPRQRLLQRQGGGGGRSGRGLLLLLLGSEQRGCVLRAQRSVRGFCGSTTADGQSGSSELASYFRFHRCLER